MSSRLSPDLQPYLYRGRVEMSQRVRQAIDEHIDVFCRKRGTWEGREFFCMMSGNAGEQSVLLDKIYAIPASTGQGWASVDLNSIGHLAQERYVLASYHVHPENTAVRPSSADITTFMRIELLAGHPMIHIIENPEGQMSIWDFSACHTAHFYNLKKHFNVMQ